MRLGDTQRRCVCGQGERQSIVNKEGGKMEWQARPGVDTPVICEDGDCKANKAPHEVREPSGPHEEAGQDQGLRTAGGSSGPAGK